MIDKKTKKINITYISITRPLCLPDDADYEIDLTTKSGVTVGWGATLTNYRETQCDWKQGEADLHSTSDVLKKIDDIRLALQNVILRYETY